MQDAAYIRQYQKPEERALLVTLMALAGGEVHNADGKVLSSEEREMLLRDALTWLIESATDDRTRCRAEAVVAGLRLPKGQHG